MPHQPDELIPSLDDRVAHVYRFLVRGLNRETIAAYAKEYHWNASLTEIDSYIETATGLLAARAADLDIEAELGKAIERYNDLYMRCDKVQDYKTAVSIQKEIGKLLKLQVEAEAIRRGRAPQQTTEEKPRLKIVKQ